MFGLLVSNTEMHRLMDGVVVMVFVNNDRLFYILE